MQILALETSTDAASCALWQDGRLFSADCPADMPHSQTLIPATRALLAEAGASFSTLDAIAIDQGPGAFTSLRVAMSIAQGLALAWNLPVLPVGSLAGLAWRAKGPYVLSLLDARMGEIYVGAFSRKADDSGLDVLLPPCLACPAAIPGILAQLLVASGQARWQVVGNALAAYPDLSSSLADLVPVESLRALPPHAVAIAELAVLKQIAGEGVDPADAIPCYVRDKVAQTTAERRQVTGACA
jgi:tRNA threonylcarbamoyladenosine biosynthesis protein TsaB